MFVYVRFPSFKFALDQMEQAYIVCRGAVASYSLRMSCNRTPQVELSKLLNVCTVRVAFYLMFSIWSLHFSLESMVSPRYLHVVAGLISPHSV